MVGITLQLIWIIDEFKQFVGKGFDIIRRY